MTTAAGTVKPATVLIYGAGVAGLQALATARRLGAVVHVTDLRPETREQVESLGGRFVSVDGLEEVSVVGGYVAAAADDVLARQKAAVEKVLFAADLVITTALVAGGNAPRLITRDQVQKMKPGAVIVDLAADAGGNCESTDGANEVHEGAVTILGAPQLAASIPNTASELFAKNVLAFLGEIAADGNLSYDTSNEIINATLIVHNGAVRT
jgi:NAD(P) transhydrogenase subunit alpha